MLPEALRLLRVYHDLKRNELAERLGLSPSYISELEKGNRTPSLDVIEKYAREFSVPASSILFFSENISQATGGAWSAQNTKKAIAGKVIRFLQAIENRTESHVTAD